MTRDFRDDDTAQRLELVSKSLVILGYENKDFFQGLPDLVKICVVNSLFNLFKYGCLIYQHLSDFPCGQMSGV